MEREYLPFQAIKKCVFSQLVLTLIASVLVSMISSQAVDQELDDGLDKNPLDTSQMMNDQDLFNDYEGKTIVIM